MVVSSGIAVGEKKKKLRMVPRCQNALLASMASLASLASVTRSTDDVYR